MKIRNANRPVDGQEIENSFLAVDDLESPMGTLSVETRMNRELMPERPYEVLLNVHGRLAAANALLGAGLTRGMMLAQQCGLPSRIYVECAPAENEKLELLLGMGFDNDDGMVRMRRRVIGGPSIARLPEGMVLVEDRLDDERERAFFLERTEQLFLRKDAEEWLQKLERQTGFARLLAVGRNGLAGELLMYETGSTGVIVQVYTAPDWRRKGIATHLMECARQRFYRDRMSESLIDVRRRMQGVMTLCACAGYRQSEVLRSYPGIDMN